MSDGGRENGRDGVSSSSGKKGTLFTGTDEFGRAVSRITVAQVCESKGFQGVQSSALDALLDIAIRYICDLGKSAKFYANLSGRTESNVFDVIQGLEDLDSLHGFSGASDVHRCLVSSGAVSGIQRYLSSAEEVPFARQVPHFPIPRVVKLLPSFVQTGETPPGEHIPRWLPALPDPHTYMHTPVWNNRVSDRREEKIEQARQHRKAERSLLTLQKRLAGNETALPMATDEGVSGKGKQAAADGDAFLAPPLPFGEREVSQLEAPYETAVDRKISVLDTFAPAIEAMKNESLDPGDGEKTILPSKRSTVHFKLGFDKKTYASLPSFSPPGSGKAAPLFFTNEEKNDKKRRAELILRESMENPEELHKL